MSRTQLFAPSRVKCTLTRASLVAFALVAASLHLAAQGIWTRNADMPTARVGATASLVDNRIYVIGGYASGSVPNLPTNEVYDPQTNTWDTGLSPMPTSRSYAASAVINGTIYVLGGGYPTATAANEAYTPATNSWDTTGVDMPIPRRSMGAAVVDSTIYLVGGNYDICECYAYDRADAFHPWKTETPMPVGAALVSTTVYNGLVYAFGGAVGGSTSIWVGISKVSAYDPKTGQWTTKKPMPTPRFGLQTYLIGDAIYAIGGSQSQGTSLATVEVYHPLTDTWEQRPPMPRALVGHAGAVVNNKIYVFGGTSDWTAMQSQVWEYNPLYTGVGHSSVLPNEFRLEQNYPNPFNPSTTISFQLPAASDVRLVVYDVLGREVETLVDERISAGTHQVTFDGTGLSSGVYVCRMTAGTDHETLKMLLAR